MKKHNCENCRFRQRYDNNPKSLVGRLWRWHIGWCPGWKRYLNALPEERRADVVQRYKRVSDK